MKRLTHGRIDRAAGNTGFASGGVTCKLGALCFYSSSVLVDSFVLRNPPERKARKRYCNFLNIHTLHEKCPVFPNGALR